MPSEYHIKVTLVDSAPAIWRRLVVPGETTLAKLDRILQAAFGWTNSHLHEFIDPQDNRYGTPDPEWNPDVIDERKRTLAEVCPESGSELLYIYDMGDSWEHLIHVEKIDSGAKKAPPLECLDGAMNGPPEDCGGVWGYANLIEALGDKNHPEHEDLADWIGGTYDTERFDKAETNTLLKKIR
ncbi:MAG: plasmid pRiA4b ORF-3 family protein [Phycisphaerales bacterium]|nr:plasmid pRiA4b ORF-3 family protein [Phycisphaerales bacterium]